MRRRSGISPVIATVILVAVTLVIAVAIIGWLMGLWSGLAGGSPAISITNQILYDDGTLKIYIRNTGGGSDVLTMAELLKGGQVIATYNTPITINASQEGWETISFSLSSTTLNPGDKVIVKLYFKVSGTQQFEVTVVKASSG